MAATIGMGNIGGVAVAISQGGPGAVFWMWVAAVVGMATKFFECTLSVMFRGEDENGHVQGGPMYYIEHGLGRRWRFMAIMFSICGMVGCLTLFQANQVAEFAGAVWGVDRWVTGLVCTATVAAVVLGGLHRIARVASALVPAMCILYMVLVGVVVAMHVAEIPGIVAMIFREAFTGHAAVGGAEGIAVATVGTESIAANRQHFQLSPGDPLRFLRCNRPFISIHNLPRTHDHADTIRLESRAGCTFQFASPTTPTTSGNA